MKKLVLLCLFAFGCSSAPVLLESSPGQRPEWLGAATRIQGGMVYVTGMTTSADTPEKAIQGARQAALHGLAQEVAVTVSGEVVTRESQKDGEFSSEYSIATSSQTRQLELTDVKFLEDYVETWRRDRVVYDGYALISVPGDSLQRAVCLASGKLYLTLTCEDQACPPQLQDRVRNAITAAGRELVPQVGGQGDLKQLTHAARQECAAGLLMIQLRTSYLGEQEGEHYAQGFAASRLLDPYSEEELSTLSIGPEKGGHYSRKDAEQVAAEAALTQLLSRLPQHL